MGISIKDLDASSAQMIKRLNKLGSAANDKCLQIVQDLTHKLEEAVVERMPVDESFLESSTKTHVEGNVDITQITGHVYIPSNAPASDYAMYMHEMTYDLGKRSMDKQSATGIKVGRKYFERALKDKSKGFRIYIYQQLSEFLKNAE